MLTPNTGLHRAFDESTAPDQCDNARTNRRSDRDALSRCDPRPLRRCHRL